MKQKYYSLDNILKTNADYYVGFGERSNGKTFSVKHLILFGYHKYGIDINGYLDDGTQGAIIRRMEEDFRKGRGASMFNDIVNNAELGNILEKETKGKWNNIKYVSYTWWLEKIEDDGTITTDVQPFCYAFAMSSEEHYKSNSYPKIKLILLDEFISRNGYLANEFTYFTSILSTIIRDRDGVRIFLMGNTISKVNPYFTEMGLTKAKSMKKGTIDVYEYGESGLKVAVEYTDFPQKKKKSDKYFAFNNSPSLKMVTSGEWELNFYPHLPYKYLPKDIVYTYFIKYYGEIFQCEIIEKDGIWFTYIHRKTTPIKENETAIIYQQEYSPLPNYKRKIIYALSKMEEKIVWFFRNDKVFYQDNEVGDMINNYILWCRE